jgi:hypothetical protein
VKQEFVEKIFKNKKIKQLIKDTFLFSAEYKNLALKKILEDLSLFDFTNSYKDEVITLRNKFAHAVLETDETGRQYFRSGEDGITFDESLCRTIRMNINKHKKSIDELDDKLKQFLDG